MSRSRSSQSCIHKHTRTQSTKSFKCENISCTHNHVPLKIHITHACIHAHRPNTHWLGICAHMIRNKVFVWTTHKRNCSSVKQRGVKPPELRLQHTVTSWNSSRNTSRCESRPRRCEVLTPWNSSGGLFGLFRKQTHFFLGSSSSSTASVYGRVVPGQIVIRDIQ